MSAYAEKWNDSLLRCISSGHDGKLNGDNLDLKVSTNDVRMGNKSKSYHFFASNWVQDRVDLSSLPNDQQIRCSDQITPDAFLPNDQEIKSFKDCLRILVGRILVKYMDGFKWMSKVVPEHIRHAYQDEMSEKSSIFLLPILLKNEAYYTDCIGILDEYEKMMSDLYTKAARGKLTDLFNLLFSTVQLKMSFLVSQTKQSIIYMYCTVHVFQGNYTKHRGKIPTRTTVEFRCKISKLTIVVYTISYT